MVAELKERLINAYPRLFSGVANKNPPDHGRFGTARIKLKPNPKIYRHREYQLQGDRAEAIKKLLAEFIERGWIEPSDSEWASPAFIVPKKEKGKWGLVVDYRGLNEQTEHNSYSLPLIDTILQKQQKKRILTVLDLKHGYHQMPLPPDSRPCTAMLTPLGVICLCLGAYRKPIFLVLHLKIKWFAMFSITIDLVGKYRTQATARRRSRERTLSWTNWLVQ